VKGVLAGHGGFVSAYRAFAAANTTPGRVYPEGGAWPAAPVSARWRLSTGSPRAHGRMAIDHMASRNIKVRPGAALRGKGWRLRVAVDGPPGRTDPAAYVVRQTRRGLERTPVRLNDDGKGHRLVGFGSQRVSWAKIVLVNASTRFSCWHRTTWSCQGRARDDDQRFVLRVAAVRPGH
jgi:hypothetical protein